MSVGIGLGDFIAIPKFAWEVWQSCKNAKGDFEAAATEVSGVYMVLQEIDESRRQLQLTKPQERRLKYLGAGCMDVLKELEEILARYRSLGTDAPGKFDRLAWGKEEVESVRQQLINHTSLLTTFNTSVTNTSQGHIIRLLRQIALEIKAGRRDKSTVTGILDTSDAQDDPWEEVIRQLKDLGLSPKTILDNKSFIASWVKDADSNGELDEVDPLVEGVGAIPPIRMEGSLSRQHVNAIDSASSPDALRRPRPISDFDSASEIWAYRDSEEAIARPQPSDDNESQAGLMAAGPEIRRSKVQEKQESPYPLVQGL